MLIDGKTYKVFDFKDISSLVSFEEWLKRSLTLYPEDNPVPKAHMRSLLGYLREAVYEQRVKDKRKWLDKIDALIERAGE